MFQLLTSGQFINNVIYAIIAIGGIISALAMPSTIDAYMKMAGVILGGNAVLTGAIAHGKHSQRQAEIRHKEIEAGHTTKKSTPAAKKEEVS